MSLLDQGNAGTPPSLDVQASLELRANLPMCITDEAGSVWRSQKLEDFGWRAKVLGCPADPSIEQLLREIQHQTLELEALRKKQSVSLVKSFAQGLLENGTI